MRATVSLRLEFKAADLWVGAFWRAGLAWAGADQLRPCLDVWICVVPMVPLHIRIWRKP